MKSLDQRLSEIISPFEDNEQTQEEIIESQYLDYRLDSLINAIGKKSGYHEFDLFLEEIISTLDSPRLILFLTDCINKLKNVYPIDVMVEFIFLNNIIEEKPKSIIELVKFFVYNKWQPLIVKYLPIIDLKHVNSRRVIFKLVKESYLNTQEKIIKDANVHPLFRYHFKYCSRKDGEKTLMILIFKDVIGVVSRQFGKVNGE